MNHRWLAVILLTVACLSLHNCAGNNSPTNPNPPTSTPTVACVNPSNTPCTSTFTITPTSTATATSTSTPTISPTVTFTKTSTDSPTATGTPTNTGTPTFSPAVTSTPTITFTPTATYTPIIVTTKPLVVYSNGNPYYEWGDGPGYPEFETSVGDTNNPYPGHSASFSIGASSYTDYNFYESDFDSATLANYDLSYGGYTTVSFDVRSSMAVTNGLTVGDNTYTQGLTTSTSWTHQSIPVQGNLSNVYTLFYVSIQSPTGSPVTVYFDNI